jgi:hypothetical protein
MSSLSSAKTISRIVLSLLVVFTIASTALAIDELNWAFQTTGIMSSTGNAQSAIAMRDGKVWPVVFAPVNNQLQAYSLYPVQSLPSNYLQSNWFQIGTNLMPVSPNSFLSAATSSDGRFGAVVRNSGSMPSTAIVGASPSGFGSVLTNVQAIDFDKNGNLLKGTPTTLAATGVSTGTLIDIAASPTGDIGVIDSNSVYYQKIAMAGVWGGFDLKSLGFGTMPPDSLDLAIDSKGRPHVIGQSQTSLVAFDFNIPTGQWTMQTLATPMQISLLSGATLAVDDKGGVGAAWVEPNLLGSSYGSLMYAYKNGTEDWSVQTVTTSVLNPKSSTAIPIKALQSVGLTFDADNLPVISFTGNDGGVYVAYDPVSVIATVPEPASIVLVLCGIFGMIFVARKAK